jgi:multidrug efflux pump subunit AcrA (membrane-fusion protein)
MQFQMSSASAASPATGGALPQVAPGPAIVHPRPAKPRRGRGWLLVVVLAVAAGAAYYFLRGRPSQAGPSSPEATAVRVATVSAGDFTQTLRVTGTISAERFVSLLAPQLGGRRDGQTFSGGRSRGGGGGGGGGGRSGGGSGGGSSSSSSSSGGSSTSSSGGMSSLGGSASGTAASGSTGAGGSDSSSTSSSSSMGSAPSTTSSLGALRGSTNRFGDRTARNNRSNTRPSTTAPSSAGGSSGLGSTAGALVGGTTGRGTPGGSGGGGGGGGGMMGGGFGLTLLKLAPAGARVKKGDVVAEFDNETQVRRLDDYKANYIQTEANIKKLQADMEVARKALEQRILVAKANLDKARLDLKTIEVRSAIESESYKLAAEEAEASFKQILTEQKLFETSQKAQFRVNEIERDQSRLELKRAEADVQRLALRAPIDGIVVMTSIWRSGEFGQVQEGDQVSQRQPFMQIVDPDSMVINASVNQVDAEKLQMGQKAVVRLDGYPDLRLAAHVTGIAAMTRTLGFGRPDWAREVPIRLKLDEMDPRVIPDLSGSADIVLATERQATLAPLASIFAADGKRFVFLRSPDGWARQEVELGPKNNIHAVIRAGLQAGSVVAAEMPPSPKNGKSR